MSALERFAVACLTEGRYSDALAALSRALQSIDKETQRPEYARTLNNIGVTYTRLGKLEDAEAYFERAASAENPEKAVGFLNLVRVLMQRNMGKEAVARLEAREAPFPQIEGVAVLKATAYAQVEKFDEAIVVLKDSMEKGGDGPLSFALLGGLLADERCAYKEAIDVLRVGERKYPFDQTILNNLAYVYLEDGGRVSEARACLEKAPHGDGAKDAASTVSLEATRGLLALWEGRLLEGLRGYRHAAKIATRNALLPLQRTVLQKLHLELARYFTRTRDVHAALAEIRRGMRYEGRESYRKDLLTLASKLEDA